MIVEGDAFELVRGLAPASVDAIVTSPPYADQRDYGGCDTDGFAEWLTPLLADLLPVLRPHGSMLLNLGRVFRDGEETPYHELTMLAARRVGWKRVDTIVWHKPNAHPFQAPQYLHNKHELIYWLAPTTKPYRGFTGETRSAPAPETVARRERAGLRGPKNRARGDYVPQARTAYHTDGVKPGSVFVCNVGKEKGIDHDAPMALDLARHLVALACPPQVCEFCGPLITPLERTTASGLLPDGKTLCRHSFTRWRAGVVLDPFLGSGTTAVAAVATGREWLGFDHDPAAVAEARRRLGSVQTELLVA